jgi:hypothetical protein
MQGNPMEEGSWLWLKGYPQGYLLLLMLLTMILFVDKVVMDEADGCALKKIGSNLFVVFEKEKR